MDICDESEKDQSDPRADEKEAAPLMTKIVVNGREYDRDEHGIYYDTICALAGMPTNSRVDFIWCSLDGHEISRSGMGGSPVYLGGDRLYKFTVTPYKET